jgi:hypothetical protein
VTQLRQKMLEELQRRNYSHRTARTYVRIVRDFAKYFHQPPGNARTSFPMSRTPPHLHQPMTACLHATARKLLRSRSNTTPSAAVPASQITSDVFTTQPGATPTRRSRNGRKFHALM